MASNEVVIHETKQKTATITDLDDSVTGEDSSLIDFSSNIASYKFVIGISKPGEARIGLRTVQKSKLTVRGVLGIQQSKK